MDKKVLLVGDSSRPVLTVKRGHSESQWSKEKMTEHECVRLHSCFVQGSEGRMERQRKRLIWKLRNGKGEIKGTGGKDQKEKREHSNWNHQFCFY